MARKKQVKLEISGPGYSRLAGSEELQKFLAVAGLALRGKPKNEEIADNIANEIIREWIISSTEKFRLHGIEGGDE